MKTLVCGGRDFSDYALLSSFLDFFLITRVASGMARGADSLAASYARERRIPLNEFPAQWVRYGMNAGRVRNEEMLREFAPDCVIAFPGGRGTAHMRKIAEESGFRPQTGASFLRFVAESRRAPDPSDYSLVTVLSRPGLPYRGFFGPDGRIFL